MVITYPGGCNTPTKKTEWLYAAQERLRHVHNLFGHWFKNPITQAQYDNPPLPDIPDALKPAVRRAFTYLKNKYPYKPQLTREDLDKFQREDFQPRADKIVTQILIQRRSFKQSTTWDIEVESI